MKTGFTPVSWVLAFLLALPALAEQPASTVAAPDQAVRDQLVLVEQSLHAQDYAAATEKLDKIFATANFNELPIEARYLACRYATFAALGRGDLITAHEYSVALTS